MLETTCAVIGITFSATLVIVICTLAVYLPLYDHGAKRKGYDYCFVRLLGCWFNQMAVGLVRNFIMCTNLVTWALNNDAKERRAMLMREPPTPGQLCFLGDSEFGHWPRLEDEVVQVSTGDIELGEGKWIAFNAGFGGSRSIDLLNHLQALCLDWNPQYILVHSCGNDYDYSGHRSSIRPGQEALTLVERVAMNLKDLSEMAKKHGVKRVAYLASPPKPAYTAEKIKFYGQIMQSVADLGLEIIRLDLDSAACILYSTETNYGVDRVHLQTEAHSDVGKILGRLVSEWLANPCPVSHSPQMIGAEVLLDAESKGPSTFTSDHLPNQVSEDGSCLTRDCT